MNFLPSKGELQRAYDFLRGREIPKMPDVVLDVLREIARNEPDISEIGELLEQDMALSGRVLKTVNSASFGLQSKVLSIRHAAVLLGINTIKEIVMLSALKAALGERSEFHSLVWRASQGNALGAKVLAFDIEGISVDSAYLAGLFNDVGVLVMELTQSDYPRFYKRGLIAPETAIKEETSRFGTNHAVISFLLAKNWKLPEDVCMAIYNSHAESWVDIEDSTIRGLIAILKITSNTTTNLLYPELAFNDDAINSLSKAYLEIAVPGESILYTMRDMSSKVRSGVL